jgi:hypothetical protein
LHAEADETGRWSCAATTKSSAAGTETTSTTTATPDGHGVELNLADLRCLRELNLEPHARLLRSAAVPAHDWRRSLSPVWLITIALAPQQTSAIVTNLLDDRFMIVSTPNDDRLEAGSCFTERRRSACT